MENKITNAKDLRFRASANGKLLVMPKSKKELISKTTKTLLIELYDEKVYFRRQTINSKYLTKGLTQEDSAITLYNNLKNEFVFKNGKYFENEFVCGTPDMLTEDTVIDIKSSWSLSTFRAAQFDVIDKNYYWQLVTYMFLTGRKKAVLAYCLVNGLAVHISAEKKAAFWKYTDLITDGSEVDNYEPYINECREIEKNHIFDRKLFLEENLGFDSDYTDKEWTFDIPEKERLHTFEFDRDETEIAKLIGQVGASRAWLNTNLFKTNS